MTAALTREQKARNRAGAAEARRAMARSRERAVAVAMVRTVGATEAVLLARTEDEARLRASVSLGFWSEDGMREERRCPETVAGALAAWYHLRGAA